MYTLIDSITLKHLVQLKTLKSYEELEELETLLEPDINIELLTLYEYVQSVQFTQFEQV